MAFKDYFFVSPENKGDKGKKEETKNVQSEFINKFPTSSASFEETKKVEMPIATKEVDLAITPDNPACAPHLDHIMDLYEKGFKSLDMEGFDFYEYFQMVVEAGINNAAAYTMAFTMAKTTGMDKAKLIEQAQYYIGKIDEVHQGYVENGKIKKESALKGKGEEEANLSAELSEINNEIARLTALKQQKESTLASIDTKYSPQLTEIECKLMANDVARERIVGTIKTVVNGIQTNL